MVIHYPPERLRHHSDQPADDPGTKLSIRASLRTAKVTEGDTVALDPLAVDVDVVEFERRIADGTPEALEGAMALYRGVWRTKNAQSGGSPSTASDSSIRLRCTRWRCRDAGLGLSGST